MNKKGFTLWDVLSYMALVGVIVVYFVVVVLVAIPTSKYRLEEKRTFTFDAEKYKVVVHLKYDKAAVNFDFEELPLDIARLFRKAGLFHITFVHDRIEMSKKFSAQVFHAFFTHNSAIA